MGQRTTAFVRRISSAPLVYIYIHSPVYIPCSLLTTLGARNSSSSTVGVTPLKQNIKLPPKCVYFSHCSFHFIPFLPCRPPSSCARGTFVPRGPPQTSQTPSSFRRTSSHFTWLCTHVDRAFGLLQGRIFAVLSTSHVALVLLWEPVVVKGTGIPSSSGTMLVGAGLIDFIIMAQPSFTINFP